MSVASILRFTRNARRLSQVDLAARLEVSARHVSFLETGRAQPTRELVVAWMRELNAPASVRNAALHEAGFSAHLTKGEPAPGASESLHALQRIIELHEPSPGLVFDADWRLKCINRAGRWIASLVMPRYCEQSARGLAGMDIIDALAHEHGLLCRMRNAAAASEQLLRQLQLEALTQAELLSRVAACAEALQARYGVRPSLERDPPTALLTFVFDTQLGELRFVAYQGAFGLLQDVTPASSRCMLWFPADQSTRDTIARRAA